MIIILANKLLLERSLPRRKLSITLSSLRCCSTRVHREPFLSQRKSQENERTKRASTKLRKELNELQVKRKKTTKYRMNKATATGNVTAKQHVLFTWPQSFIIVHTPSLRVSTHFFFVISLNFKSAVALTLVARGSKLFLFYFFIGSNKRFIFFPPPRAKKRRDEREARYKHTPLESSCAHAILNLFRGTACLILPHPLYTVGR